MFTSEHILLESDESEVPDLRTARKLHGHLRVPGILHRRAIELYLIDYYYLAARVWHGRSRVREYVLDLRFVDPALQLSRHIPWRSIAATALLVSASAASLWFVATSQAPWPWGQHGWLAACAVLLGLTACAVIVCWYRTTLSLVVQTQHGRARVLELTGRLGTFNQIRRFALKLAAHSQLAAERRRPKTEQLRNEMREHRRLKEAGVLAEKDYEAAKSRILAAYDETS